MMTRPTTKSAAFRSAYNKGRSAGMRGIPNQFSRYLQPGWEDVENYRPTGWSLVYDRYWLDGWVDGVEQRMGKRPEVTRPWVKQGEVKSDG